MPHVSRRKLSKKTEQELTNTLHLVFTKIHNNKDMKGLLSSLFSETENLMFAKRLAMVTLLKEGISDSTIADSLHVTRETVNRIKLLLEIKGQGYDVAINVLRREKVYQSFKKLLISLAQYSIRAAGGYVKP